MAEAYHPFPTKNEKEVPVKRILLVLVLLSSTLSAQNSAHISDFTISSGRGALSSGLFASVNTKFGQTGTMGLNQPTLALEMCDAFVQAIYTETYGSLTVGPSAGFFKNAPWVAPFIKFKPTSYITFVSWTGISAGQANAPAFEAKFSFAYHSLRVDIGPVWVSHTLISFQKDRLNQLSGAGFNIPLSSKMTCFVGCAYSLRDSDPLFSAGLYTEL